jgi:hypothetical protein
MIAVAATPAGTGVQFRLNRHSMGECLSTIEYSADGSTLLTAGIEDKARLWTRRRPDEDTWLYLLVMRSTLVALAAVLIAAVGGILAGSRRT